MFLTPSDFVVEMLLCSQILTLILVSTILSELIAMMASITKSNFVTNWNYPLIPSLSVIRNNRVHMSTLLTDSSMILTNDTV